MKSNQYKRNQWCVLTRRKDKVKYEKKLFAKMERAYRQKLKTNLDKDTKNKGEINK